MIIAEKFGDWHIPRANRQEEFSFNWREASFQSMRGHGSHSSWGTSPAPAQDLVHEIPFTFRACDESEYESIIHNMARAIGSGTKRLWFTSLQGNIPRRFADAYALSVEETAAAWRYDVASVRLSFKLNDPYLYRPLNAAYLTSEGYTPETVAANVFGESWEERIFASFPVTASPTDIEIDNIGHIATQRLVIRVVPLAASGAVNPKIENLTTEQYIKYLGTLTTGHVLQANCAIGPNGVRLSTDSGASLVDLNYPDTNVYPDIEIDDLQGVLMELAPGVNDIRITADGTPNFKVMFLWLPAYLPI